MPCIPRHDAPDTWHHVTNRGIARRTVFETRADVRRFLAFVARSVRRGTIEVHAYCVMTTHFHLLVRSPQGRLSDAMQWIEDSYARWFNRSRRRDGALFRARFKSVPVRSNTHWSATLAYIDRNSVDAHIVPVPSEYPWCSASHYARTSGPRWLCRTRVESLVAERAGVSKFRPDVYDETVGAGHAPHVAEWVERTLRRRTSVAPHFDDLVGATPQRVRTWMERKARLADGVHRRTVAASTCRVLDAVAAAADVRPDWFVRVGRFRRPAWEAMRTGLLRGIAGSTLSEIAASEGVGETSVRRRERWHRTAVLSDREYRDEAARVAATAIAKRAPN
jgi:REP element-mobilizing transposase RayT